MEFSEEVKGELDSLIENMKKMVMSVKWCQKCLTGLRKCFKKRWE